MRIWISLLASASDPTFFNSSPSTARGTRDLGCWRSSNPRFLTTTSMSPEPSSPSFRSWKSHSNRSLPAALLFFSFRISLIAVEVPTVSTYPTPHFCSRSGFPLFTSKSRGNQPLSKLLSFRHNCQIWTLQLSITSHSSVKIPPSLCRSISTRAEPRPLRLSFSFV